MMSGLSNYYTTTLKAAPTAFLPSDDDGSLSPTTTTTNNNGASSNTAVVTNNIIRGSQQRTLSQSYGGEASSVLSRRMPAVPTGELQRCSTTGGSGVRGITYSGYLYKRSNRPHLNPSQFVSSSDTATGTSPTNHHHHYQQQIFPQHHPSKQQQDYGTVMTTHTTTTAAHHHPTTNGPPANMIANPSAIPEFPEIPGIFNNNNNNNNTNRSSQEYLQQNGNYHSGRGIAITLIEDHQVPDLRKITMRSPPSLDQMGGSGHDSRIPIQQEQQPTPVTATTGGTSSRIVVVTPSPLNATDHTHASTQGNNNNNNNNNNAQLEHDRHYTQQSQMQMDDQVDTDVRESETKNPLQVGLESVAAFFGIQLDSENENNRNVDVHSLDQPMDDKSPTVTTESTTSDTTTMLLATTNSSKLSSSPIEVTSHGRTGATPSRPIPLPTRNRQSFHDAHHRRHSAPTDIALSTSDKSTPELECRISPNANGKVNANGIPQNFYDLKDGHLWTAKYCVLEDGILYFYRNATDGQSTEASMERKRSANLSDDGDPSSETTSVPGHHGATAAGTIAGAAETTTADASISRRRSSAQDLSKSPMPVPMLRHLDSNESADTKSSMWEKRVFMDCVGGVRTAEQQFGPNSFELIALDDDDVDQSHIDTLVLRASNRTEMEEWIFQFHFSLASFMRNIMDVFGSTSTSGAFLDILHPPSMQSAGTEHHISTSTIRPLTPGGIPLSPSEKQLHKLHTVSPRFHNSHHGATHNIPPQHNLSHGHGRTSLKRRSDAKKSDTGTASLSSTPDVGDTDAAQQDFIFFEPSPDSRSLSPEVVVPPHRFLIPPPSQGRRTPIGNSSSQTDDKKATTISPISALRHEFKLHDRTAESSNIIQPPKPPSGKYIPPALRNKSSDGVPKPKYVPPSVRRQQEQTSGGSTSIEPVRNEAVETANGCTTPTAASDRVADRANVPLPYPGNGENAPCTPPPGASAFVESNGTVDQLDVVGTTTLKFVRGGCADPQFIQGSITDRKYISKRTSRVGQVASQPFGSYGGGRPSFTVESPSNIDSSHLPSLRWEAGAVSECGVREHNEDAYLITNDLLSAFKEDASYSQPQMRWKEEDTDHSLGVFAVFDGHLGNEAARFAVENLAHFIHDQLQIESYNDGSGQDDVQVGDNDYHSPLSPSSVEHVLREAMIKMDDRFCQLCQEDGREWESGATALVAMIANEHLVIANLGDCRGVLCRFVKDTDSYETDVSWSELATIAEDQLSSERTHDSADAITTQSCFWKEVTTVHTPSAEAERLRIEAANGWIRTDIEIPMAQLRRMDFSDEDVIRILRRCFNYFESNNDTPTTEGERSVKECKAAPQRILDISRVCGELAVSRALGDRDFKAAFNTPSTNDMSECCVSDDDESDEVWWESQLFLPYPDNHSKRFKGDLVSNTPDIQRIKVGEDGVSGEFLLLACDGLWDVMDYDDAVRVARDLLFRKRWTAKKSAVRLAELAMHLGSSDNVTVVLIRLFSASTPDGR